MAGVNWAKLAGEVAQTVANNAQDISTVSRMSPRSQATFALGITLFASLANILGHLHDDTPVDSSGRLPGSAVNPLANNTVGS